VAGAATFALLVALGWTMVRSADPEPVAVPVSTPPVATDLSQMSPRQTADQLFNRVMAAAETGDTAVVQQFMPMALQAYEAARPLDMDGLFHLALLQKTGAMFEAALATANEMLDVESNHILGLAVAAEVAAALGREDEAAGFYRRILEHHDTEITRLLPEYQSHSNYFGLARDEATSFLLGR
jgi:tetratricopeptide (TPR) repeat protein